jgi:Chitobiase/beta-hexosaminidase C-terminal domain/FG-GAP-like repeat
VDTSRSRSSVLNTFSVTACLLTLVIAGCSSNTSSNVGGQTQPSPAAAPMPTFTPGSGTTFTSALSVSLADSAPGATIYYTTDGTTPTTSSSVYSGPLTIDATTTVKALAIASGNSQSQVVTATYTSNSSAAAATPNFSPASGTIFSSTLTVSLSDSTPNATIYYTTNGTTPTTASQVYSSPFTISASTTVKAIATASGDTQSAVGSASYTFPPTISAATPTFTPASGTTFPSTLSVSLNDSTPNATIYYTTNGTTPTTASSVYSGPITINATTTIEAIATATGYKQSSVNSATYTYSSVVSSVISDNFDEPSLNTSLWKLENPLGDGIVSMNGSGVTLNVPAGSDHDLWTSGDNALRIVQSIANMDFSVDVRFQSAVEIGNQDEGILVEQDSSDFLRFDVDYMASVGPVLFAAGLNGSNATTFFNTPISLPKGPVVLRLARSGNLWTASWSTDGTNFAVAGTFTFGLNVADVGPYAGTVNTTTGNTLAFTATVDYFFNTANPISNQDGPKPYGYVTVDPAPAGTVVEKTLADIEGTGHMVPVIGLEAGSQAGNISTGGIYWYSYPASGNVNDTWTRNTIVSSGNAYEDMLAYDVNGDGAVDVVASFDATFSGNYDVVWFENPRGKGGNPARDPWLMHTIGPGFGENTLLLQDIDGDGKMDIVTPSSIFFQNSPDSWTQVQYSNSVRGVALLDISTGNGKINLVGTQPTSPFNLVWWENPRETGGNARTGSWIMHTIGPGYPCSANNCGDGGEVAVFQAMDINGDGTMDVISAQSEGPGGGIAPPPGGVIWWQAPTDRRNGTWIKHTIDANMVDVHQIALGDMDRNGTLDIIVAEQDQAPLQRVNIYYNDGKGSLTAQVIANAKGHNICVGNVIGNQGELDILNSGHGFFNDPHPLQIFLNPY